MVVLTGTGLSRRAELVALWATGGAALIIAVVPTLYVVALPGACGAVAAAAPGGRRLPAALVAWASLSLAALVGGAA